MSYQTGSYDEEIFPVTNTVYISMPTPKKQDNTPPEAKIKRIQADVDELAKTISTFSGTSASGKDYIHIDETMLQYMMQIDNIENTENSKLRASKRELLENIKMYLDKLEKKLNENIKNQEVVKDTTDKQSTNPETKTNNNSSSGSNNGVVKNERTNSCCCC